MSFTATIMIKAVWFGGPDAMRMIDALLTSNWSYNCFDHIEYLPPGDQDNYEWQHVSLASWSLVKNILQQKSQAAEQIGIGLTYNASKHGGTFVITPEGEMHVLLFADRVAVASTTIFTKVGRPLTDFSWYVERIAVPLMQAGFEIEAVQCSDDM